MECSCTLAALRGHRKWKVYDWGGNPPTESIEELRDSGLLTKLKRGTIVYTDGCQSWKMVARENRKQSLVVKSVVHMRSEWTRKVRVRGRKKVAGTQQIDRCWNHLKKNCPSQMKNHTGPTINARFWDRIYPRIYRHNMSEWDIASSCEMKKRLCKLFVVS